MAAKRPSPSKSTSERQPTSPPVVTPYNPLSKIHLGESVARALILQPVVTLPPPERFSGAGIYAIYYTGRHPLYSSDALENAKDCRRPIYVGKAIPPGARMGGVGLGEEPGSVLFARLREHADSILRANESLSLLDFRCRYLVVDDIWIPLGESLLIQQTRPLWNEILDGFGNHDPGKGRYNQKKSAWDVVHPGRPWAEKCAPSERTLDELKHAVTDRVRSRPPLTET